MAPRLNAASRIGDVREALLLLIGEQKSVPKRIRYLEKLNTDRKQLTKESLQMAQKQKNETSSFQYLFSETWEVGILGLLAGKMVEDCGKPVIAATFQNGVLHSSCRAPEGYSLVEGLKFCEKHLIHFGGHHLAAGFQADVSKIEPLLADLEIYFSKFSIADSALRVFGQVEAQMLDLEMIDILEQHGPFGIGNPKPLFLVKGVEVLEVNPLGDGQHMKVQVTKDDKIFLFLGFFMPTLFEDLEIGKKYDFVLSLGDSWWQGQRRLETHIVDVSGD